MFVKNIYTIRIMQKIKQFTISNRSLITTALSFFALFVIVCLILFYRMPNNVTYPNFYAEDGSIFLQNIIDKGWLQAIFSSFNGYSIIGLYFLCALGWIVNIFLGEGLLSLSQGFAIASIISMAVVICTPYFLFKGTFGKAKMLIVVLLGALVPLPTSPHVVIGNIGNQKWIFLYLAFLLAIYRILNFKKLNVIQIISIDLLLVISAYTNANVYLLFPVLFMPFVVDYFSKKKKSFLPYIKLQLHNKEFLSLVVASILLLPQVVFVAVNGIPKMAGYLDTPFNPQRAIELFINRTYLFEITHSVNGHMNNLLAVSLFILIVALAWIKLLQKEKIVFFIGLYIAGFASLLFTLNRPGVTDHFLNYSKSGSGPDQFFYTQTLIMIMPLALLISRLTIKNKNSLIKYALPFIIFGLIIFGAIKSDSTYGEKWRNASVFENNAGTFIDQSIIACKSDNGEKINVILYPDKSGRFSLNAKRESVCNDKLTKYQLARQDLGLQLNDNDYISISKPKQFTQTFVANQDNLNGISIFISTFAKDTRKGEYKILLMDQSCKITLRQASIPQTLADSSIYNIRFDKIDDSSGHTYCFVIEPPSGAFDLIALQKSAEDKYAAGALSLDSTPTKKDLVFEPLYSKSDK